LTNAFFQTPHPVAPLALGDLHKVAVVVEMDVQSRTEKATLLAEVHHLMEQRSRTVTAMNALVTRVAAPQSREPSGA